MQPAEAGPRYCAAGLSSLPAVPATKRPALNTWSEYQRRSPTADEWSRWAARGVAGTCIVTGAVSGHLEIIDFDLGGAVYADWDELVDAQSPGLLERLVVEQTPGGGFHVVYRCEEPVPGSVKLAMRPVWTDGPEPVTVGSRDYTPRQFGDRWAALVATVETRGEGGQFLCFPSPRYEMVRGDLERVPTITAEERAVLIAAARSLDETPDEEPRRERPARPAREPRPSGDVSPGDDYTARGDVASLLRANGWRCTLDNDRRGQSHWVRPGKSSGTSATLRRMPGGRQCLKVFTSNGWPLPETPSGRSLSGFAVFAYLEHGGDFSAAARDLGHRGYGSAPSSGDVVAKIGRGPFGLIIGSAPNRRQIGDESRHVGDESPSTPEIDDAIVPMPTILERHPTQREPVIAGLLRVGETANIIAATKARKSWLALGLACCIAKGDRWLSHFDTAPGRVLIVDNELHPDTIAHRWRVVARELDAPADRVDVLSLRGQLLDVHRVARLLEERVERGRYRVVMMDALYRFLAPGMDENSNADMMGVYNRIDSIALALGCAIVLVHHTSKGSQGQKSVTDTGAGAGAAARATDAHIVFREHEEPDTVVLEAATRSFPPIEPICVRWEWPLWRPSDEDPERLKGRIIVEEKCPADDLPIREWAKRYIAPKKLRAHVITEAKADGASERSVKRRIQTAIDSGLVIEHRDGGSGRDPKVLEVVFDIRLA